MFNHDVGRRLRMITALLLEWAAVPLNDTRKIIGSMRHCCTACMRDDGGYTKLNIL